MPYVSKNAVQQVADMIKARKYALEEMPGIFELYRIIQLELLQFDFHSHLDCQQTIGIPDKGYMGPRYIPGPYLKITDKLGMDIGYISITNR